MRPVYISELIFGAVEADYETQPQVWVLNCDIVCLDEAIPIWPAGHGSYHQAPCCIILWHVYDSHILNSTA